MRHLHFDCCSGIAGDMVLGALVNAGGDFDALSEALASLPLKGWRLERETVMRAGIAGTRIHVVLEAEEHTHRHLPTVERIIAESSMADRAKERATRAFRLLAEAEGRVHRIPPEKVHFHEVGAVDAIIDICGAMHLATQMGVESASASAVNVGSGTVKCAHGTMPVPAPATAELLSGVPTFLDDATGEMATPTGCAILRTLATDFGRMPTLRVEAIGNGAGTREIAGRANFLRVMVGMRDASVLPVTTRRLLTLSAEIDDMTPELLAPVIDRAMEAGAVDAHIETILMKKGRPGWRIVALAAPEQRDAVAACLLRETSTLGLKIQETEGLCLERRFGEIETPWGKVRIKIALWGEEMLRATPEYEDCRRLAADHGLPVQRVFALAQARANEQVS